MVFIKKGITGLNIKLKRRVNGKLTNLQGSFQQNKTTINDYIEGKDKKQQNLIKIKI
jgi:hypothetical protein